MSAVRLGLVFVSVLVVALIARAPMSAGLALAGLGDAVSVREVEGTIWNGRLVDASVGRIRLGDIRAGLAPATLLAGRPAIAVTAGGGAVDLRGQVLAGGQSGVEDLTGTAPLALLGAPAPFDGSLVLKSLGFAFSGGSCRRAAGMASIEVSGLGDAPFALAGQPACRGDSLVLALGGERAGARVTVEVRLRADGRYRTEARVATGDEALAATLSAAGFDRAADGFRKITEGHLR